MRQQKNRSLAGKGVRLLKQWNDTNEGSCSLSFAYNYNIEQEKGSRWWRKKRIRWVDLLISENEIADIDYCSVNLSISKIDTVLGGIELLKNKIYKKASFISRFFCCKKGGRCFMKIDWKQKLTSRKFWAAVIGFVTSILVVCNIKDEKKALGYIRAPSLGIP